MGRVSNYVISHVELEPLASDLGDNVFLSSISDIFPGEPVASNLAQG